MNNFGSTAGFCKLASQLVAGLSICMGAAQGSPGKYALLEIDIAKLMRAGVLPIATETGGERRASFPSPTARVYDGQGKLLYATASYWAIEGLKEPNSSALSERVDGGVTVRKLSDEMKLLGLQAGRPGEPLLVVYETEPCPPCEGLRKRLLEAATKRFVAPPRTVVVMIR